MAVWSQHRSGFLSLAAAGLVGITVAGAPHGERVIKGECAAVNGADVCTWGTMSGKSIVSFGATVPVAAAQNAPDEMKMEWPPRAMASIPLPAEVTDGTGFTMLTVFWEAHGHPPGPYLVPHFDFHFYTITPDELDAIDCADATKPSALPAGYELPDVTIPDLGTLAGICVPKMGMHSLPGTELQSPTPFEKTMVMGYYRTRPIFIEPMITRAALLAKKSFTLPISAFPEGASGVRYPTAFRADYDAKAQAYRFTFSKLAAAAP